MPLRFQTRGTGAGLRLHVKPNSGLALTFPLTVAPITNTALNLTGSDFTLETWCYVTAWTNPPLDNSGFTYTGSDTHQYLMFGRNAASTYAFRWSLVLVSGQWYMQFFNYTGAQNVTGSYPLSAQTWMHLRVDYQASTKRVRMWVDNVLRDTFTLTNTIDTATNNFSLGHLDSNRANRNLYGQLDAVRWWKSVRTDAQNAASWKMRNTELSDLTAAGAYGAWDFEDVQTSGAATYADSTANGITLKDSQNSGGGKQRGSTVPYDTSLSAASRKLAVV